MRIDIDPTESRDVSAHKTNFGRTENGKECMHDVFYLFSESANSK